VPVEELSRLGGLCLDEQQSVRKNDETGEFRLEGVPAGDYWLEATGWTIHELTAEKGNAPRVTVPPGGTVRVDTLHVGYVPRLSVELMRRPSDLGSYEVTGFIRPAGSSGPGEQIFVWHEGGDRYTVWAYRIWSRALCPGRYDIVIASRKEASRYVSELHTMDLTADPPKGEASFELGGGSVRGRVVMPDGETGVPRITVTARAMAGEAVILNGRGHDWGHMQTDTDAEGGFTIPGLLPGDYELRAHLPEEFYGPQPTLRFALSVNEQAAVLLRAEHAVW
jgi:hypothetical protein